MNGECNEWVSGPGPAVLAGSCGQAVGGQQSGQQPLPPLQPRLSSAASSTVQRTPGRQVPTNYQPQILGCTQRDQLATAAAAAA